MVCCNMVHAADCYDAYQADKHTDIAVPCCSRSAVIERAMVMITLPASLGNSP